MGKSRQIRKRLEIHPVSGFRSNSSNVLVTVAVCNLRKNAVFNRIRDGIITLAQQSIQRLSTHQEDDMNDDECLTIFQEQNSDDETDFQENSQDEDEVNDERTTRIVLPEFLLDGYIFAQKKFEILTERLPSSLGDYKLKYELFDGKVAVRTVPSDVHGRAVGVINATVITWAENPANRRPSGLPLSSLSDTSMSTPQCFR